MKFLAAKDRGEITIFGVPFDGTTCFRPGARFAPAGIRFFSENLETYSPALNRDLDDIDFCDAGDLEINALPEDMVETVYSFMENVKIPVMLGGEHSVTFPVVKALKERYGELTVIHFDAHTDLRDIYSGTAYSHACVMRRVLELGCKIVHVGVRSGTLEEFTLIRDNPLLHLVDIKKLPEILENEKNIYFSIDIDYFDPAFAPGTGTPEPCGGTPVEFFSIIYNLPSANIVGFDIVEVSPPYDPSGITQMLAAKVVRELILKFWGG
ncbi:agmatinase [Desulfurobacterium atlanticum]|uniref:Agmatinase n=1 Tax=Desulfurobacterium atlanticum TaxID=240169 RepID=A0A238ZNI7_9BACT|nr:agmatinase [Desulfurobacterium atlanticum]SNR84722.1 agmatinase [Desulfurobacterium atlanticum]